MSRCVHYIWRETLLEQFFFSYFITSLITQSAGEPFNVGIYTQPIRMGIDPV